MTDDLLRRAAHAVRDTTASVQPRSGLTRARILDQAEKRYASPRTLGLRWVIAFLAALGASTALARVVHYWPEISRALTGDSARPQRAPQAQARRAARQPKAAPVELAPAPQPTAAGADASQVVPALPEPSTTPPAPKRRHRAAAPAQTVVEASAPAPVVSAAPRSVAESGELTLFRRAQRLHLARDPQAIVAWDDYLRVVGQGVLVPEARYNRALCLVRLGRAEEARAALEPFARGDFRGYRREEALALLEALARGDRKP